jgi:hypothetical protein
VGALGDIDVSVFGPGAGTEPFLFEFDDPAPNPTQPTLQEGLGIGGSANSLVGWSMTIVFSGIDTAGLVLGVGNFGHGTGSYPGHQLQAFDSLNTPISPVAFGQIGSYDHTWITDPGTFNDDLSLSGTGDFVVTTVPGRHDFNSDILLLSLPAGVARLEFTTSPTEPGAPSGGDTINIVATPEPGSLSLLILGALVMLRRRRAARVSRAAN